MNVFRCAANASKPLGRDTLRMIYGNDMLTVRISNPLDRKLIIYKWFSTSAFVSSTSSVSTTSSIPHSSISEGIWDDMHGLEGLGNNNDKNTKKMSKDERAALLAQNITEHARKMDLYRKDTQTLANWLDLSVVNMKGRLYPPDFHVLPTTNVQCIPFPVRTQVTTLHKNATTIDDMVPAWSGGNSASTAGEDVAGRDRGLRLIAFSFKNYGYTLCESWLNPFLKSHLVDKIPALNICFVEYGFLSLAKGAFVNSLRDKIPKERWAYTAFSFGGVMDFACDLLLPNKFTGYVYLVDGANRVRWRACGLATEAEAERMLKCAEGLYKEQENMRAQRSAGTAPTHTNASSMPATQPGKSKSGAKKPLSSSN